MLIYKILTSDQWAVLEQTGHFDGARIDHADGYIHASTAAQVQETVDKHFSGQTGLWVVAFDDATFGDDLRWEVSRGGAEFPHIYGRPLRLKEALWAKPVPVLDGQPKVPLS